MHVIVCLVITIDGIPTQLGCVNQSVVCLFSGSNISPCLSYVGHKKALDLTGMGPNRTTVLAHGPYIWSDPGTSGQIINGTGNICYFSSVTESQ